MKRLFLGIVLGSLGLFASVATADGPMVRWNRVEGFVATDIVPSSIGPFTVSPRWRSTGGGRVMLDLGNGFISVRIEGVSWANHYSNAPLGSPAPLANVDVIGTVVCNSTSRFGALAYVDTPIIPDNVGSLAYEGFLELPAECATSPDELVFLVRQAGTGPLAGTVLLYGAGRTIQ
jgi:hypothetical protein